MKEKDGPAKGSAIRASRLYLCTPDRSDLLEFVAACISGGVDIVQLREKSLSDRELTVRATALAEVCRSRGVPFILNDRADLALACGADGVHVGQDDLPAAAARRILGPDAIVGLSTHSPEELRASEEELIDYVSVGPVVETPTKPGRPGTGIAYLRLAAEHCSRPFFVTGGVTPDRVPELAVAGADRFVVVRYLTEATDPASAARRLREVIEAKWHREADAFHAPAHETF